MSITTIDQAYEKVKDRISRKDFDKKIKQKVDDMDGICDTLTASLLVLSDLGTDTRDMSIRSNSGGSQQTIVDPNEMDKIAQIKPAKDVSFIGVIVSRQEPQTYKKKDGGTGTRANMMIGDETGKIRVTLWDEKVEEATGLGVGDTVEIYNSYGREWNGVVEASLGYRGSIKKSEKTVRFTPKTTKIIDISPDTVVTVKGTVTGVDPLKDFVKKKDGRPGRLCPVWVSDDTARIRITFWDEAADQAACLNVGDQITVPDAKAKESMNGEVELSASNGFMAE